MDSGVTVSNSMIGSYRLIRMVQLEAICMYIAYNTQRILEILGNRESRNIHPLHIIYETNIFKQMKPKLGTVDLKEI